MSESLENHKKIFHNPTNLTQIVNLSACVFICTWHFPVVFNAYCSLKINKKWTYFHLVFIMRFSNVV